MRGPVASAPRTFISPQLCTLVDEPPAGPGWVFELKYDGYRMQADLRDGKVRLLTRRGLDWTHRFTAIADALARVKARRAVIDGEVVVVERNGRSSFRMLQKYLDDGSRGDLAYFAFDLLSLDGTDLRDEPLSERRKALKRLLGRSKGPVQLSEILPGRPDRIMAEACKSGFEGIIGKRLDAPYETGRSRTWVKVKCGQRQEFVVVGYTLPGGSRRGIGALLLAVHERKGSTRLRFAGAVGTGFTDKVLQALRELLDALRTDEPPFPGGAAPRLAPRDAVWVRPRLLAEVAFTEWTDDGRLRHPSFQGLREDKAAQDITQEAPMAVAGVTISNPDRVVYPDVGITKVEVARHMEHVAKLMLPHVAGRPLAFVRCPEGIKGQCFFQKHPGKGIGDAVDLVRIKSKDGTPKEYAVVRDVEGLVSLVQFGILEIHLWGCRDDAIEKPDRVVFDLDPDPKVGWETTLEAAFLLRKRLTKLGLKSWPKTTGGKGVHVVVPIERRHSWDEVRAFARAFAEDLEAEYPHDFVSGASKKQRKGKIFVDWLRNGRGSTWIAPWCPRARPGAPVGVPLSWSQLEALEAPDTHSIASLRDVKRLGRDPWAGMLKARQTLARP